MKLFNRNKDHDGWNISYNYKMYPQLEVKGGDLTTTDEKVTELLKSERDYEKGKNLRMINQVKDFLPEYFIRFNNGYFELVKVNITEEDFSVCTWSHHPTEEKAIKEFKNLTDNKNGTSWIPE